MIEATDIISSPILGNQTDLLYKQVLGSVSKPNKDTTLILGGLAGSGKTTIVADLLTQVHAQAPDVNIYYTSLGQAFNLARERGVMPLKQEDAKPRDLQAGSEMIERVFDLAHQRLPSPALYVFDSVLTTGVFLDDRTVGTDRGLTAARILMHHDNAFSALLLADAGIREHAAEDRTKTGVTESANAATMDNNIRELYNTMATLAMMGVLDGPCDPRAFVSHPNHTLDFIEHDYYPYWIKTMAEYSGNTAYLFKNEYIPGGVRTNETIIKEAAMIPLLRKATDNFKDFYYD